MYSKLFLARATLGIGACLLLHCLVARSQRTAPIAYPSEVKVNYVRTWDALTPETDAGSTLITKQTRDVRQNTSYFDGLGRLLQTVTKQGAYPTGSSAVDMVKAMEYDAFGREQFSYLPSPANNTGGNTSLNDGLFKFNPFQQQQAFMQSQYTDQNESWFYSQTEYENSPLSRPLKTIAAGNSWVGADRGVEQKYWINTANDGVRIWTVTDGTMGNFGSYNTVAAYTAGELSKNVTVDERGMQVVQFTDKEGKTILKKVQLTATADDGTGIGHAGWLCTYYIYDDLSNLRCVIQPQGSQLLLDGTVQLNDANFLAEQCFRYEYDERNRMIMKKVPGAAEVYMVYDARDRLVMTQDGNLRTNNKWMVTLYDDLNRPVQTGLLPAAGLTFDQYRQYAATISGALFNAGSPPSGWEWMTQTGYDDYSSFPSGTGLSTTFDNSFNTVDYINTSYNSTPDYAQEPAAGKQTQGMVTWTMARTLSSTATYPYIYTINFYDNHDRLIQTQSTNIENGKNTITMQYSWNGQVLRRVERYTRPAQETNTLLTKITYDNLWRVDKIEKKIVSTLVNSGQLPADWTLVAQNEYDALGQLKQKKLAQKNGTSDPLAKLDYRYNIRGWLLSVNKDYITNTDVSDRYFGMELGYDKNPSYGSFTAQYNGNIGSTVWKSAGDDVKRSFAYSYDPVNRITAAGFGQWTGSTFTTTAGLDFSVSNLAYDANGNILSMKQKGYKLGSGSSDIDDLQYNYYTNSNRLKNVIDNSNDVSSKLGDFKTGNDYLSALGGNKTAGATDYSYDANGSLVTDFNKDITSITYNHLNLPDMVTLHKNGEYQYINYVYDAFGNKLMKVINEPGQERMSRNIYIGPCVYTRDSSSGNATTFRYIGHEEGRIRFTPLAITGLGAMEPARLSYDYFIKDHLGNTRAVLTTEQQVDYYPAVTLEGAFTLPVTTPSASDALYIEQQYYNINTAFIQAKPASMPASINKNGGSGALDAPVNNNPNSQVTNSSQNVYRLNGTTNTTGLGITLRVMAGDKVNIFCKSFWKDQGTTINNLSALPATDLVASLLGTGLMAGKGVTAGMLNSMPNPPDLASLLNRSDNPGYTAPRAYVNWVVFDDRFTPVIDASSFDRIGASGSIKDHNTEITIPKNGYIYVYCSNLSDYNVFFDNLQLVHRRGALLEETHYYPFGLEVAGISSKALKADYAENKKKYNGIEFTDDLDLDIYDAFYRNLDPAIARWWQIDPKVDDGYESVSPYASMYDDPIRYSDPLGDEGDDCCQEIWDAVVESGKQVLAVTTGAVNAWSSNQVLGVGRINSNSLSGTTNLTKSLFNVGQAVGDGISIVTGILEEGLAAGGELASLGFATPLAIPVAVHGASAIGMGAYNLIKGPPTPTANSSSSAKPTTNKPVEAKPSAQSQPAIQKPPKGKGSVPPSQRDPKRLYTEKQKAEMLEKQNGNCANCGEPLPVKKSVGHHKKRHADGGQTTTQNGAAVCKECHVEIHQ